MKEIFIVLKTYKKGLIIGPIFKLIEAIIEVCLPLMMARIIDSNFNTNTLAITGGIMLVLVIAGVIFAILAQYIAAKTSQGFGTDIRNKVFAHVEKLSKNQITKFGSSNITNRIIYDTTNLEQAVAMFIRLVIRVPFICIMSFVMTFIINKQISGILFVAIIVFAILIYIIVNKSSKYLKSAQKELDNIVSKVKETITNIRLVRSFVTQKKEIGKFENINKKRDETLLKSNVVSAFLNPATTFVLNITIVLILYLSNINIATGKISGGELIAIINYITQILAAIIVLSNLIIIYTRSYTSAIRIAEVLNEKEEKHNGNITEFGKSKIAIEFKNVDYSYTDKEYIKDMNFKIEEGQTIGIVGGTGSGKTTILQLINNTYNAKNGEVLLYGKNIQEYNYNFIKSNIDFISQDIMLLNDTIENNVLLGREKDKLMYALKEADALEFVEKLDLREKYLIREGGVNLSGGQKQRIAIARAYIGDGKFILLDCATNALDNITEKRVIGNLVKYSKANKITTIITSQKIDNLKSLDKIMILDNGSIKAF